MPTASSEGYMATPVASFDPTDVNSPKAIESDKFKAWADDAASSLRTVVNKTAGGMDGSQPATPAAEDAAVALVTRRICRQIAKQIPPSVYAEVIASLKSNLKVVEQACQAAVWDADSTSPCVSPVPRTSMSNAVSPLPSSQQTASDTVAYQMEDLVCRRVPQEISKFMAKELFAHLVDDSRDHGDVLDDGSPNHSSISSMTGVDYGETAFPRSGPSVGWNSPERRTPCTTPEEPVQPAGDVFSMASVDSSGSLASQGSSPPGGTAAGEESDKQHQHRKFYHDNNDPALQADAFKKFKLVLVRGRGFRVVKHNHGGGRKTRILKYNPDKNRMFWESSRVLGGEYVDCSAILRVNREENVTYVWHATGRSGTKKMVGFETQREYDARILELALLHLHNQGGASGRARAQA